MYRRNCHGVKNTHEIFCWFDPVSCTQDIFEVLHAECAGTCSMDKVMDIQHGNEYGQTACICPCCLSMSMSMLHVHVRAAWLSPHCDMQHGHGHGHTAWTWTWTDIMYLSMLYVHVHVHTACPCPCFMTTYMLQYISISGYTPYFNRTFTYEIYYYRIYFYEIYFYSSILLQTVYTSP